jgi:hypothetical protein
MALDPPTRSGRTRHRLLQVRHVPAARRWRSRPVQQGHLAHHGRAATTNGRPTLGQYSAGSDTQPNMGSHQCYPSAPQDRKSFAFGRVQDHRGYTGTLDRHFFGPAHSPLPQAGTTAEFFMFDVNSAAADMGVANVTGGDARCLASADRPDAIDTLTEPVPFPSAASGPPLPPPTPDQPGTKLVSESPTPIVGPPLASSTTTDSPGATTPPPRLMSANSQLSPMAALEPSTVSSAECDAQISTPGVSDPSPDLPRRARTSEPPSSLCPSSPAFHSLPSAPSSFAAFVDANVAPAISRRCSMCIVRPHSAAAV